MSSCVRRRDAFVALLALVALSSPLLAADFEVGKLDAAAPSEVSASLRENVGSDAIQVSRGGEPVAEFWLRSPLPVKEGAADALGVAFPGLDQGAFVGVARIEKPWRDYKDLPVAPGVYTLRYALRPADGNHMGVSTYRDFLLLIPVAEDPELDEGWSTDELRAKSMPTTGTPHPATLALFPVWDAVSEPAILENDTGQPMLAAPLGGATLGLVIEGQGTH